MLEELVSSRIRRALLEHILLNPEGRFYLRGLAKTLHLSVTPLRRELKRLEHAGMLKAVPEGNIVFYLIVQASPAYRQLRSLGSPPVVAQPQPPAMSQPAAVAPPRLAPVLTGVGVVGAGLVLAATILMNHRLLAQAARALTTRNADVTVVVQPPAASGAMRGAKWQIVPGGVGGGFHAASNSEAY